MTNDQTTTGKRAQLLDLDAIADRLLEQLPGHRRKAETVAREAGVSVVVMALEAGDEIKEHQAPGVVTVHLLRGHASLGAAGADHDMQPAQVVFLQPGVPHSVRAVEQSVIVLTVTGGSDPK